MPLRSFGLGEPRAPVAPEFVMILRAALVSAVLFIGVAPAAPDTINTPTCRQDLASTWSKMEEMLVRLKSAARAGLDEKCEDLPAIMPRSWCGAREVFRALQDGTRSRSGDVAQMDGALGRRHVGHRSGVQSRAEIGSSPTYAPRSRAAARYRTVEIAYSGVKYGSGIR